MFLLISYSLHLTLSSKKILLSSYIENWKHTKFHTIAPSPTSKGGFTLSIRRLLADVSNTINTDEDSVL